MSKVRVGAQLHPQHCTWQEFCDAFEAVDALGVDTLWTWDHFYPLYDVPGSPHRGDHFEGWTLLAAMAARTRKAEVGLLVGCNSYRNPQLVADMARTVDHISGGRAILGLGAGWFEKDYTEYGYEFGTAPDRLRALRHALPVIEERLGKLTPPPLRSPLPIMIGGGGEKVTLRLVARHAHLWNGFGPPEEFARKNAILDEHCRHVGRDPAEVERTVLLVRPDDLDRLDDYVQAGAQHLIVGMNWPFPLEGVRKVLDWREARG